LEQHFLSDFISVPGSWRPNGEQFKYFQFVLGNAIGFIIIAKVLLPLYYLNLTSIYGYIEQRLGMYSYKTATIFLISRTIGSAFRLYLVVIVLQRFVLISMVFLAMTVISLALIFAYTYRGGLKRSLSLILYKHFSSYFGFLTIVFICNIRFLCY
jgi:hypothetical protein